MCNGLVSVASQTHGFPKVMGVLTHLDGFKDAEKLKKTKKALKHRFWTEIYQGALCFAHRTGSTTQGFDCLGWALCSGTPL